MIYCSNFQTISVLQVVEIAVPTWKLVLPEKCKFLNDWCEFIETEFKKAISKDTWDILVDFINQVPDFDKYDDSSAWPTAIDEVCYYCRATLLWAIYKRGGAIVVVERRTLN